MTSPPRLTLTEAASLCRSPPGDVEHASELDPTQPRHLGGVQGCASALLVRALRSENQTRKVVLVTLGQDQAERAADNCRALDPKARLVVLPHPEASPYDPIRPERSHALSRTAALTLIDQGQWDVLVCTASGWIRKAASPEALQSMTRTLTLGGECDLASLSALLDEAGYQRLPLTEDPGTFSIRGDILDLWPPTSAHPIRVELEFESVVKMSLYDAESQRTLADVAPLRSLLVGPGREFVCAPQERPLRAARLRELCDAVDWPSTKARALIEDIESGKLFTGLAAYLPAYGHLGTLADRLPKSCVVLFEDASKIVDLTREEHEKIEQAFEARRGEPHFSPDAHFATLAELDTSLTTRPVLALHPSVVAGPSTPGWPGLGSPPLDTPTLSTLSQEHLSARLAQARKTSGREAGLEPLIRQFREWHDEGLTVVLSARNETQATRLASLLSHRALVIDRRPLEEAWSEATTRPARNSLYLSVSPLAQGLIAENDAVALLTEEEIFGRRKHTKSRRASRAVQNALDDLRSLSPSDFVVHIEHGIGRYLGLEHRTVGDIVVELLIVEYSGGDRLLLPVYRLNQIQKFSGEGAPRLDRLGGTTFAKTKSKAKKRVRIIADQLLKLYAERKAVRRTPIDPPGESFAEFEASFPYEETSDQAAAIADVVSDLQKDTVMDRLVCGDVGFGKTEVALRAAFLAIEAGRQVALLCPTTVLSEQHLRTVRERFTDTATEVASLSRFVPKKTQERVLSDLKSGRIDLVVGTHRLLSQDVHFKNLGLLIIDEEQRFGVKHKERILELRRSVDVLTLSATPIPRTLSLAIGGMRDMSVINTAPQQRRAIRTFTSRFDEQLVKDAIVRELDRGGQVYFVYNRVEGIYERAALVRSLLPDVKVAVGHGQLTERQLEKTMYGFVQGDSDVLCATAIVESGLDIPRANTIIIDRADLFGLSQLYQLRGRVGRSKERGYCYLLVPPEARLSAEARARIETLERYTELGSGFHVATMDMELRGAGEFLGADQSGFMEKIGFELFAKMLEEATAELSGETYLTDIDPELSLDVEALLPESYIEDIGVRLSLYKKLASAEHEDEVASLSDEIADRFGAPPREALRYFEVMRLKTHLRRFRALSLSATPRSAQLVLNSDTPLSPERLVELVHRGGGAYQLSPDGRLKHSDAHGTHESGLSHATFLIAELSGLLQDS